MSNRKGKRIAPSRRTPPVITADDRTRKPITKQRSMWRVDEEATATLRSTAVAALNGEIAGYLEPDVIAYTRNVGDGRLDAFVGTIPTEGIHLSIAHKRLRGGRWEAGRYPTWDEIADARDALLPAELTFVMYLPKEGDYLAVHPTTFHLHQEIPPGVVRGADGSYWRAEPILEDDDGKVLADEEGYPLCRLVPYGVTLNVIPAEEAGEGDVTPQPGTAADAGAQSEAVSPGPS